MSADSDQRFTVDAIDENRIRTVVKLLLIAAALIVLWALFSALPGLDRVVPSTAITFGALGGAVVTLGLVVVLAYVAIRIEPLVKSSVRGPPDVVADGAAIIKYFLVFVAVIVAYEGFTPFVTATLGAVELVWVYDVLFLVLAAIPMGMIGVRMYRNLEDATELIVAHLTSNTDDDEADGDGGTDQASS